MKITFILFLFLIVPAVYADELPVFFDAGIDSYMLSAQDTTLDLLKNRKESLDLGFHTYEFNLGESHLIQFVVHPGSVKFEISEIQIIEARNRSSSYKYPGKGISKKGISLGISKQDLISKIGKPTKVTGDQYEYRAEFNDGILKNYNMPIYYGKYTFDKNKLITFSFGFEYP